MHLHNSDQIWINVFFNLIQPPHCLTTQLCLGEEARWLITGVQDQLVRHVSPEAGLPVLEQTVYALAQRVRRAQWPFPLTCRNHAVGMGGGRQAVGGGGVVHEDRQGRVSRQRGEGVSAERLTRHSSLASLTGATVKLDVVPSLAVILCPPLFYLSPIVNWLVLWLFLI